MRLEEQALRIPERATAQDIPSWMELVRTQRDYFPGLDEREYEAQLKQRLDSGEARQFRKDGKTVAALLFSYDRCEIDFLAVSPPYRRHGLARKLMETAAAQFP